MTARSPKSRVVRKRMWGTFEKGALARSVHNQPMISDLADVAALWRKCRWDVRSLTVIYTVPARKKRSKGK